MKILKKVSVSTVFGRVTADEIASLKENGGEIPVGRFYGVANGSKQGTTQFGVWTGLTGSFRAVDFKTGEMCQGPVLLLPMGICEQVAETLKQKSEAGEIASATIAVDIFVKFCAIAGEDKYEYIARANEVPAQDDPLEKLAASLGPVPVNPLLSLEAPAQGAAAALEAPKTEAAPAKGKSK